jgi:hypothetical protein
MLAAVTFDIGHALGLAYGLYTHLERWYLPPVFKTSLQKESNLGFTIWISHDSPVLFITLVTKDRLPVFA